MAKGISFFLILNLFLNSFSSFCQCNPAAQEELEKILKAEAAVIAYSTAALLPIEIMKRAFGGQAVPAEKPSAPKKKAKNKPSSNSDFAITAKEDRFNKSNNSEGFYNIAHNRQVTHCQNIQSAKVNPRAGPFEKLNSIIIIFLLIYLVLLAITNLPENMPSLVLKSKPDLPWADRVFYLRGI